LAYCGLADTYAYMGGVVMPSKEAVVKEKEFAQKAMELDPELPEAHLSFACALAGAFDWRNAQIEFDRAIELNPNLAWAYEIYAWFLGGLGRLDEAFAAIYLGLGEKEKALDWLDVAYENQESACWLLKVDPIYDSVRGEPRFQALVKKVFRDAQ